MHESCNESYLKNSVTKLTKMLAKNASGDTLLTAYYGPVYPIVNYGVIL